MPLVEAATLHACPEELSELACKLASFGCVDAHEMHYTHRLTGRRTGLLWQREVTIHHAPHILSFLLDISDRKLMEEELQRARNGAEAAARAKSEFLANPVNQVVIVRMLGRLGCAADLVSNGIDVLRQVQAGHYDLVLMDIQMPGIDGQEASRRIRALSPVHSRIPIVALTASATVEDRGARIAAGMNDYLSKPLSPEALRKVLEHWGHAAAPSPGTGVQPSLVPGQP